MNPDPPKSRIHSPQSSATIRRDPSHKLWGPKYPVGGWAFLPLFTGRLVQGDPREAASQPEEALWVQGGDPRLDQPP